MKRVNWRNRFRWMLLLGGISLLSLSAVRAAGPTAAKVPARSATASRAPASAAPVANPGGGGDASPGSVEQALEVRGQRRAFTLQLLSRGQNDIQFGKVRRDWKDRMPATQP